MKSIPISAAKYIAKAYGYDQVIVIARKVGDDRGRGGEHMTTYGINGTHCDVAARVGSFLQREVMGWHKENEDESD